MKDEERWTEKLQEKISTPQKNPELEDEKVQVPPLVIQQPSLEASLDLSLKRTEKIEGVVAKETLTLADSHYHERFGQLSRTLQQLPPLLDRYFILEKIGEGGMGDVYKARHQFLNTIVALKVINSRFVASETSIQRFFKESKASGLLNHPHIVRTLDAGESQGFYYLVMEYIEGIDLATYLKKNPLTLEERLNFALDILAALAHAAEKNIVHRDLKPENILITQKKELKLLDFGLAKILGDTEITQSGSILGTAYYMSPEQARGDRDITIVSDLYALGVTFFYLFTEELPFTGKSHFEVIKHHLHTPAPSLRDKKPNLPEFLDQLVTKLLAKEKDQRYQHPLEVQKDLEHFRSTPIPSRQFSSYSFPPAPRINTFYSQPSILFNLPPQPPAPAFVSLEEEALKPVEIPTHSFEVFSPPPPRLLPPPVSSKRPRSSRLPFFRWLLVFGVFLVVGTFFLAPSLWTPSKKKLLDYFQKIPREPLENKNTLVEAEEKKQALEALQKIVEYQTAHPNLAREVYKRYQDAFLRFKETLFLGRFKEEWNLYLSRYTQALKKRFQDYEKQDLLEKHLFLFDLALQRWKSEEEQLLPEFQEYLKIAEKNRKYFKMLVQKAQQQQYELTTHPFKLLWNTSPGFFSRWNLQGDTQALRADTSDFSIRLPKTPLTLSSQNRQKLPFLLDFCFKSSNTKPFDFFYGSPEDSIYTFVSSYALKIKPNCWYRMRLHLHKDSVEWYLFEKASTPHAYTFLLLEKGQNSLSFPKDSSPSLFGFRFSAHSIFHFSKMFILEIPP
jgi:serine/threonine protein kinase